MPAVIHRPLAGSGQQPVLSDHPTYIDPTPPALPVSGIQRVEDTLRETSGSWLSFEAYRAAVLAAEARRAS